MPKVTDPTWPSSARVPPRGARLDDVPIEIDALRGQLYRVLDQLARARPEAQDGLIETFERAWTDFREAIARPH